MEVAQFQNEDRIKISIRTVEHAAIHTIQITSDSALHRITHASLTYQLRAPYQ
jgi:hypothetical protein